MNINITAHLCHLNKNTYILQYSKLISMRTTKEYILLISSHADELKSVFGIRSLRIFGSVSRNEQKECSDIDICVDMEPKMFLVVRLKRFLENLLQCSVDVVRMHKHIKPYLLEEINKDGIYVLLTTSLNDV